MAEVPDQLTLRHNRDREGAWDLYVRRVCASIILAIVVLGALNAFGQRPTTSTATVARFTIRAREDVRNATLVLDPGWAEAITINTIEPSPIGEGSENGRIVLELGHIPAGQKYVLFMHLQVNPTNVGHRSQDVELRDGDTVLAKVDRTITLFP